MTTANEVKDIISLIQELDSDTGFNIFIPSLQKDIKFKQLTTEQLKRLLKTIVDSPIYNTEFTLTFNSIIKENCLTLDVDTDNFNVLDKVLILFKTRIESISPDYTINFTAREIEDNKLKEKTQVIPLADKLTEFLNKKNSFAPTTIEYNNCSIVCNLPTLATENKLEKELHKNIKIDVESPEELRNVVGETFINELTKHFDSITINDKNINLTELTFKNRIKIVETLPTNIINQALKYIENYRNTIKSLFTFKLDVETTAGTTAVLEKELPLDASFFNM
jgi:hypothetical protein